MRQDADVKEGPLWGCRPGALVASNTFAFTRKVPSL